MPAVWQKKLGRKGTRKVAREIVLPDAVRHAPTDTGALAKSLKVRAIRRSRTRIGHEVVAEHKGGLATNRKGFPYGIAQEFGSVRGTVESPYLRPAVFTTGQVMKARSLFKTVIRRMMEQERIL